MKRIGVIVSMLYSVVAFSQKTIEAIRVDEKITVNADLSEEAWNHAPIATDFLEINPTEGNPPRFKTEVKVIYDNNSLYISAYCYDSSPDSILRQLGERDDDLNADLFTFSFDPYDKKIDAFVFSVSASGVQSDYRFSDYSFNAVWNSAVEIVEDGWIVEMEIPYYAIRFPAQDVQNWRMQFEREIRRSRTELQWSLVPKNVDNSINYWGYLKGLEKIEDPLRLSLSPYASSFVEYQDGNSSLGYGAGADLKYGLNEAFTLDVTLLPDFSQVRSDNIIKNLGAFEVVFEEQRPFFQEGVDLFNLGELFYSRRIGGVPTGYVNPYYEMGDNEVIAENPITSKLLNVAKVSGRNKGGLGIGVMNALTGRSYATLYDTLDGSTREVVTNPLVNYNIVALDKNLKNNSSVYFINLNTTRDEGYYDANVTALGGRLVNKSNSYAVFGNLKLTQLMDTLTPNEMVGIDSKYDGSNYSIYVSKIRGNIKFNIGSENISPNYNPNDLGVNFQYNIRKHTSLLSFNKYNPFWILNESYNNMTLTLWQDYTTNEFQRKIIQTNSFLTLRKSFHSFFVDTDWQLDDGIDQFESRVPGQRFMVPRYMFGSVGVSSDYRRKIAIDGSVGGGGSGAYGGNTYSRYKLAPIIRFTDKFTLRPSTEYVGFIGGVGYAGENQETGELRYGKRDVRTLTNLISGKYLFKNNLSLTIRLRHYWSYGQYQYLGNLDEDGYIIRDDGIDENFDFNFNAFNTDVVFSWQYGPGSFLNIVYKNALAKDEREIIRNYAQNVENVFTEEQHNVLTVKLIYFFDAVSFLKR